MSEIEDLQNNDPYFRALISWKESNNLRGDSLRTGRISSEGGLGNFTGIQNIILECLPLALRNCSSGAVWKLVFYLMREIIGRTRNGDGNPKSCLNFKPYDIKKKALIDGSSSFYNAKKILEDKKIIYFKDDKIFLNLFPLTWNVERISDKAEIDRIIENEIKRIYKKIERNNE